MVSICINLLYFATRSPLRRPKDLAFVAIFEYHINIIAYSARSASFQMSSTQADRQIGNEVVYCLAAAMADKYRPSELVCVECT